MRLRKSAKRSACGSQLWLTPYNGNTGTVIGKVTYADGSTYPNVTVTGLQKQATSGYGTSVTYNSAALKPDDILVENWGTTDVTPGHYTVTTDVPGNLGEHDVVAGQVTYVSLFPVWLPYIRNTNGGWCSRIIIWNSSSTYQAKVTTTFFNRDGSVNRQQTDSVPARNSLEVMVLGVFDGSALVVSSEDIAVVARERNADGTELNEYNGIAASTSNASPGWEKTGATVFLPLIKHHRYGRTSRIEIANAGLADTIANVQFYDVVGGGVIGTVDPYPLAPNASTVLIHPEKCTSATARCSARIVSSNAQPLAVTVREQDERLRIIAPPTQPSVPAQHKTLCRSPKRTVMG